MTEIERIMSDFDCDEETANRLIEVLFKLTATGLGNYYEAYKAAQGLLPRRPLGNMLPALGITVTNDND